MSSRVPPQNIDAEKSVLGAILLDNDSASDVLEVLSAQDFYQKSHSDIYAIITELLEKRQPADLVTLTNALNERNLLDTIGGAVYLASLVEAVPTAANVLHYARIVRDKSILRGVITAATDIVTKGYDEGTDVAAYLDQAEKVIFEVAQNQNSSQLTPIAPIIKESFIQIEQNFERKEAVTGLSSGFKEIDKMTAGLQPSDLIIIAGRPAMGKTSLCMNIAENVALGEKKGVAVFSLEMSKKQLVMRMLCSAARIDASKLKTGMLNEEEWQRLTHVAGPLSESGIYIDDTPSLSSFELRARARRMKAQTDLSLIIVDYLQLMTVKGKSESREREISEISRSLKAMAKELDVPVIALSQLNRAVESRNDKRPMLSDLRESGSIEQDADLVGFIYRDEVYNEDTEDKGIAEFNIVKHRHGPVGKVRLAFLNECTRFENLAIQFD
ncbi:MAG TPA: replicative DNA helicase [Oligoflexia bacterium]|nr:replicative DNA helicase [Oligoflexia bacterium]HMR25477.1 replicative DNA helicase [Oligoflexia bacterium]